MISSTDNNYELRRMLDESNSRIGEIYVREKKAISEGRYNDATQIAYSRLDEQKHFNQILLRLRAAL